MNIPVETANAAMSLAGGVLALIAAIIAAVTMVLPKDTAIAAMAQLRAKTFSFISIASGIASSISILVFDAPKVALFFIVIYVSMTSINYLKNTHPATRVETFILIIQINLTLAIFFLYMIDRLLSVLVNHA
jgi:hypothetical protein